MSPGALDPLPQAGRSGIRDSVGPESSTGSVKKSTSILSGPGTSPCNAWGWTKKALVVQGPDNFFVDWFTENCFEPLERAALEGISGHLRSPDRSGPRTRGPDRSRTCAPRPGCPPRAPARDHHARTGRTSPAVHLLRTSSSARTTISPPRLPRPSPTGSPRSTTRSTSTALPGLARRTSCRRSGTTSSNETRRSRSTTCRRRTS